MGGKELLFTLAGLLLVAVGLTSAQLTNNSTVPVNEPAFIVIQPSRPIQFSGGRVSITCVAYGNPAPWIVWSSESQDVENYAQPKRDGVNVNSMNYTDPTTGLVLAVSILEMCDVGYNATRIMDFTCTALNDLSDAGQPLLGVSNRATFDILPEINEPAVLLVTPMNRFSYNGSRISATCVAYGSPRPRIWFSSPRLGIANFDDVSNVGINVYTTEREILGDVYVISTLEICSNNIRDLETYLVDMQCSTGNGVERDDTNAIGVQSATFRPQPYTSIESFDIGISANRLQITFTISSPYDHDNLGCFLNKLTFTNLLNRTDPLFQEYIPRFPGTCVQAAQPLVIANVDNRDYRGFLEADLLTNNLIAIITNESVESDFAPPLGILPITIEEPLLVSSFEEATTRVEIVEFDFDVGSSQLIIHFNVFVDLTTLVVGQLTLGRISNDGQGPVGHTLSDSVPSSTTSRFVKTVCLNLSVIDIDALQAMDICTHPDNCSLHAGSGLVMDYNMNDFTPIDVDSPLTVSVFRRSMPLTDLYMRLTVEYIGCSVEVVLREDEPYILREDETVVRIDCYADGDNINPDMYFNGQPIARENKEYNWPTRITFSTADGIVTAGRLGQFTCAVEGMRSISHLINDKNPSIFLPDGDTVTAILYDPIRVPVVYGTVGGVVDLDVNSVSLSTAGGNPPTFEVEVNSLTSFRVELVLKQAQLSYSGSYMVRVVGGGSVPLNIVVNPPRVTISPSVLTLLPGQQSASLECTAGSSDSTIPVVWARSDMPGAIVSNSRLYEFDVGNVDLLEGTRITCSVRDPENDNSNSPVVVAMATAIIRNIEEPLVIYELVATGERRSLENNTVLNVPNRFSSETQLQCLGDPASNTVDLVWTILRDDSEPFVPMENFWSENYTVTYGNNEANLTIVHTIEPFRGALRCVSRAGNTFATVFIQGDEIPAMCPPGDIDTVWGITWDLAFTGGMNGQPCPQIEGTTTSGTATRRCLDGGVWERTVDTSDCRDVLFTSVETEALDFLSKSDTLSEDMLMARLEALNRNLNSATAPKVQGSHFPKDLNTSLSIATGIIEVLMDRQPSVLQTDLVETFDNLLEARNTDGWKQLQEVERGSVDLLQQAEDFGRYLSSGLRSTTTNTSLNMKRKNIAYSVTLIDQSAASIDSIVFEDGVSGDVYVKIELPGTLLRQPTASEAVNIAFKNLNFFLPEPEFNENITTVTASLLISSQIVSSGSPSATFSAADLVKLEFDTIRTPAGKNPRVVFWDSTQRIWSTQGVVTSNEILESGAGDSKSFNVKATSNHLTAFGVAVDANPVFFNFSIAVYVGCGVVLVASLLSIFALLASCLSDGLRSYFTVAFFTHISFAWSLICAFTVFLAGIELALQNRIGCAATAGLLHYFFTAAFTWLLCESLLMVMFQSAAKKWSLVFVFILIGWGLPIIPTAISLGLQHESYGPSGHCWFFFDGEINDGVVLGFIIPKLAIIAITIFLIVIGMIFNFRFAFSNLQPSIKKPYSCMLWFLWSSTIFLTLLLGATWVFAMLMVNFYGLDSATLGWIFLGVSAALGIYLFIFSVTVLIVNQKIDYDRMLVSKGSGHVDDGGGTGYKMMEHPEQPNRRSLLGGPIVVANPVFETAVAAGDEKRV